MFAVQTKRIFFTRSLASVGFRTLIQRRLEAVMNSIRNGLGMRETEIARAPSRP
jgi:hypothetical protein